MTSMWCRVSRALAVLPALLFLGCQTSTSGFPGDTTEDLPWDSTHPFIWDNDSETDQISLAFALAAAHNGELNLVGITRSPNPYAGIRPENFQDWVDVARDSGWQALPNADSNLGHAWMAALARPASESIDEALPLDTSPAQTMMQTILSIGTPTKPVVVATGGAVTTLASAYLLALRSDRGPEFASKVVACLGAGRRGAYPALREYNAFQDGWAVYIVLNRLRTVIVEYDFDFLSDGDGEELWRFIAALPDSPIAAAMKHVQQDTWPPDYDRRGIFGDINPIVAFMHPTRGAYSTHTARVTFDRWDPWGSGPHGPRSLNWNAAMGVMVLREDPTSQALYVNQLRRDVAKSTFFNTFRRAFSSRPLPPDN